VDVIVGLSGRRELVVEDALVRDAQGGQTVRAPPRPSARPADVRVGPVEAAFASAQHVGDQPDLAVPVVAVVRLGQGRYVPEVGQRLLELAQLVLEADIAGSTARPFYYGARRRRDLCFGGRAAQSSRRRCPTSGTYRPCPSRTTATTGRRGRADHRRAARRERPPRPDRRVRLRAAADGRGGARTVARLGRRGQAHLLRQVHDDRRARR